MPSKIAQDRASLCSFLFADGRQCRMLKKNKTSPFCYFHQHNADVVDDTIRAGEHISSCLTADFVSNCSLTAALCRTFISVARGDYDLKTARTLAYLAQLMAKTLPGAKHELALSGPTHGQNSAWSQARTRPLRRPRQHGPRSRVLPFSGQRKFPPPARILRPTNSHNPCCGRPLGGPSQPGAPHASLHVGLGFFSPIPENLQFTISGMHPMPLLRIKYQQWLFYSSPW